MGKQAGRQAGYERAYDRYEYAHIKGKKKERESWFVAWTKIRFSICKKRKRLFPLLCLTKILKCSLLSLVLIDM